MATNYTTSFDINVDDLQYILKQIKIAESTSVGYTAAPLSMVQAIIAAYGGDATSAALLPAGLRTVDGSFNNLRIAPTGTPGTPDYNPGTSLFGAADTLFPRLTDPIFINSADGDSIVFGPGAPPLVQGDYGLIDTNGDGIGDTLKSVVDADPRIISNLIVDMSVNNPAAIAAYLSNPLSLDQFAADHPGMNPVAPGDEVNSNDLAVTNTDLQTMPNQSPDIGLSPGFNAWMTFFGQFFDHGLDLVTKGANGTVYIPLTVDDPLYDKGADGIANNLTQLKGPNGALYWNSSAAGNTPPSTVDLGFGAFLASDDGFGLDGIYGTADDRPNFMALTRATATVVDGVPQTENTTTPWIDQNQTYTSNASHQVFLREYAKVDLGNGLGPTAVSTGRLIDGSVASGSSAGAIGNWGEVKAQALTMLGIKLDDFDVNNVPLLLTDQYGKFIPGAHGYAQLVMKADATHPTAWLKEGTAAGITTVGAELTNHAFLNDIAHHAAPGFADLDHNGSKEAQQIGDADIDANHNGVYDAGDTLTDVNGDGVVNTADFFADDGSDATYDNEMLESHFITGDGRGNENIALSTVHSIFHSEHNRAVEADKATILKSGDLTFINEWLLQDVTAIPTTQAEIDALVWDGDRLFQAGRFSTEMQYQHLVFEEFARRIQPAVDPFIFTNSADLNPSIVAEFAHTVYRFGHSMLTGTVDRLENDLTTINGAADQDTLLAVFLNPQAYTAGGVDAATINADLIRGLSRDVGNAMDEFIVTDVRSNLLGLPLDLAALNIARGRDTGIPSLNETRTQLYAATGLNDVKPYANWAEFASAITNPMSIINFIAAYGTHSSILAETTIAGMRDAAMKLVFGDSSLTGQAAIDFDNDRFDFLSATGAYADSPTNHHLGGMNDIDLWIGGLAEAHPEFGGMLGTTFNYVFEYQMESLQNGDRFYYLSRTQGLNFLNQLEPNTFSDLVMRNTELGDIYSTHLNGFLFVTPDYFLELDRGIAQEDYDSINAAVGLNLHNDPLWGVGEAHSLLTPLKVTRSYTGATTTVDPETSITHDVGGTLKFFGGEHVVVGGTEGNDKIWTDRGIDTLWGDGGDDYLNAGTESDNVFGGAGDDIIEDPFGDDMLRGNQGNDVISSARGADILFGDQGQDFITLGQDASEVFAGQGNDFLLGGLGSDALMGNEGDDWVEGGEGFDGLSGENSQLFFNSTIIGHDVLNGQGNDTDYDGESGDDIMFEGAGIQRNNGMFGFDWGIHKGDLVAANSDLGIPIFATQLPFTLRDRFDSVEGLSGWKLDDTLTGAALLKGGAAGFGVGPGNPVDESDLKAKNVNLINGLADLLGITQAQLDVLIAAELAEEAVAPTSPTAARSSSVIDITQGAEIIIGGGGSDTIKGNLGDDYIDGDAWLNVKIAVHANKDATGPVLFYVDSLNEISARLLAGTINPGQLQIVREILHTNNATDVDTAVFNSVFSDYTITNNADGSVQVTDNRAAGTLGHDGSDRLNNIERLQFTDRTVALTPPVITSNGGGDTAAINFAENNLAPVTTVTAGTGVIFSLSGVDALKFNLDATTGVLNFVNSPNFEAPSDAGANNVYNVIVTAVNGILADDQALAITVTNVNDAATGALNITGYTYNTNSANLQASNTISDPDGMTSFVQYQWQRQATDGTWSNVVGATSATLANQSNSTVRVTSSYADPFGTSSYISDQTVFITAATGINTIVASAGNDILLGLGSSDRLTGAAGNDVVDGGRGSDILFATINDGNDTYIGGIGTDTYNLTLTSAGAIVNLTTGTSSSAQTGNDTLSAIESVVGSSGSDTITDGAGVNRLEGFTGNDTFILTADTASDDIRGGVGSSDTVNYSALIADLTVTLDRANQVTIFGTGNGLLNNDVMRDVENFIGGSGNDTISGDNQNNVLTGGAGNDLLRGNLGMDILTGGLGDDIFDLNGVADSGITVATRDQIADFEGAGLLGGDLIDLAGFTGTFSFIGTAAFSANGTNELRYQLDGSGNTIVQIDTDNDTGVESSILLLGVTTALAATDFVL